MPFPFSLDPLTFFVGFLTATIFWWLVGKARPLLREIRQGWQARRELTQARLSSSVEENHRRTTHRRAQGMHLAAPLFSLNELLEPPLLIAPPAIVAPGGPLPLEDAVTQTLPYLPAWPELAAIYNAPTLTLPQALSGGCHLVITAQPGSGKTVALAHLASLAANQDADMGELRGVIPFLLHTADLRLPLEDARVVLDVITDALAEHAPVFDVPRLPGFVQYAFRSGRALLLLDGYDELAPAGQQEVIAFLKALLEAYPKTRVVTTGCPENLGGLNRLGFVPVALMGWGREQRERFAHRWGDLWARYVAVEAWAQSGPEQIDPLLLSAWLETGDNGLSPLEFTLKVWAAYAGDSLGPRVLDAIATHIRRVTPDGIPPAALEMLAMQIMLTAQPLFDPRRAREWVKSFEPPEEKPAEDEEGEKPKAKPTKAKAVPTPGLLGRLAESGLLLTHPNNRMRFLHPVFGGYLAGRALSGYSAEETLLGQDDWTGKLQAMRYLAAHGDASALADALLQSDEPPLHRPIFTAARWLRDAPRETAWRGKVFAALAALLQDGSQPMSLRAGAMAAFALSADPGTAILFRQLLQSAAFDVVALAALGSGVVQDSKAVESLAALFHAPSQSARQAACLALVAIGAPAALETLARALLEGDEDLRRAAAEALANEPTEGHATLREGATMSDILLRRAVVYGLARIRETWAVELLQHIQVEDEQWVVRNSAAQVLESREQPHPRIPRRPLPPSESPWLIEFASKHGVGVSPGAPATDILLTALKEGNIEERLAALQYLKRTPVEGVLGSLYHLMYSDEPEELREAIFLALSEAAASGVVLPHPNKFGVG